MIRRPSLPPMTGAFLMVAHFAASVALALAAPWLATWPALGDVLPETWRSIGIVWAVTAPLLSIGAWIHLPPRASWKSVLCDHRLFLLAFWMWALTLLCVMMVWAFALPIAALHAVLLVVLAAVMGLRMIGGEETFAPTSALCPDILGRLLIAPLGLLGPRVDGRALARYLLAHLLTALPHLLDPAARRARAATAISPSSFEDQGHPWGVHVEVGLLGGVSSYRFQHVPWRDGAAGNADTATAERIFAMFAQGMAGRRIARDPSLDRHWPSALQTHWFDVPSVDASAHARMTFLAEMARIAEGPAPWAQRASSSPLVPAPSSP